MGAVTPFVLTIVLEGLPPTALSHNARARRGSRMARSRAGGLFNVEAAQTVAHWRDYARIEALKASRGLPRGSLPAARLTWTVCFEMPNFSRFARDELNALERMAPIMDGLVAAELVQNDTWPQVRMQAPPERVRGQSERTILTIWLWAEAQQEVATLSAKRRDGEDLADALATKALYESSGLAEFTLLETT